MPNTIPIGAVYCEAARSYRYGVHSLPASERRGAGLSDTLLAHVLRDAPLLDRMDEHNSVVPVGGPGDARARVSRS